MNNIFDYKGVCLQALRNLTATEHNGNAFMENLGKDKLFYGEFDYDEFYKIAPKKDIFYCATTGKCYLPLKSDNKGQLVEYNTNPEQLLRDVKYVIVRNHSCNYIVSQLAHDFKGSKEVVAYVPEEHLSECSLIFDSEEQASNTLNSQPKWVKEQHKVRKIIGHLGFWRLS